VDQVQRRKFLTAAGLLLAAPLAPAQKPGIKVARIGFLFAGTLAQRPQAQGFWQELQELGYTPGKNVVIEVREAGGNLEQLPELAKELVSLKPDVLVAVTPAAISAAQRVTSSIPIVMAITSDPVGFNFVRNLAHPEGNITGPAQLFDPTIDAKRLQLLKEMLPNVSRVGAIWNAKNYVLALIPLKRLEAAASSLGVEVLSLPFQGPDDLESAFTAAVRERPQALVSVTDPVTFDKRAVIIAFAAAQRIPTIYFYTDEAVDGGLIAYGVNLREEYRRVAPYVDKILKGAKPADLPVDQSTKFELVVNLKAARPLGITVPQSILVRADRVI
jgi:putative ABC transport system substrate-binding protein